MYSNTIFDMMKKEFEKSTCLRRQVCAIIVDKNKTIQSIATNQSYARLCKIKNHCLRQHLKSGEDLHKCRAIHAEVNCIINFLDKNTMEDLKTCSIWVSHKPCSNCFSIIAYLGIKEIHYFEEYGTSSNLYTHIDADAYSLGIRLIKHEKPRGV